MNKALERIAIKSVPIMKENGVVRAGIFGSYARGEARKGSDIDILVQFRKGKSLFDLVGLEIELKKLLKKNVDLVTYNSIHPLIRKEALKDEVRIL